MRQIFTRKENKTDEELLVLYYKNKDSRALNILYNRYMEGIYGNCMYLIKDVHTAEDTTMEVFALVTKELNKKPKINNFKAWLFILTRNYCLRKLGKKTKIFELFEEINEKNTHLLVHNPDEMTLYNEMEILYEKVDHALQELSDVQQTCIELFYLQEKGYKEIAHELNITTSIVRSNIQNGRRNLRNKLSACN